ncbi:hypothetical protein ACFUJY_19995 [Streptomyces sp. NPDC057249]|uniref:hypothetical protein n=1 Tax=Streptomyces sp. NPDC057249 TaxID=3346067 RepID=UPI0036370942
MHTVKHWFNDSLVGQGLLVFGLGVGLNALLRHDDPPAMWLVQGAVFTVVAMVAIVLQRRRMSRVTGASPGAIAGLLRKIRHHEVPRDPRERAVMRRLVDDQLGKIERGERWLPYWLGAMGLIAVGLLVLGFTGGALGYSLFFAVFVAAFCVWLLWTRRRALTLYRDMRRALREQG